MTQWYYVQNGQQAGPVDDATFRQWIAEGRIGRDQLVWREGMAQWQAAGMIPGLFSDMAPAVPAEACCLVENRLADPPSDGSGGLTGAGSILGRTLRIIVRNFPLLLAGTVLTLLIQNIPEALQQLISPPPNSPVQVLLAGLNIVWSLCVVLPMSVGAAAFSLRIVCGQAAQVGNIFSGFRIFGKALKLQLWTGLLIFLWSLLLIIPGIIAALRYSQAVYLITYRPDLKIGEALRSSSEMMKGHKGRLFSLGLLMGLLGVVIFIPLWILVMGPSRTTAASYGESSWLAWWFPLALTVPFLMLQWTAMAEFHRDLTPPAIPVH